MVEVLLLQGRPWGMRHHVEERGHREKIQDVPSPHQGLTGVKEDFLDLLDEPSTSWMQLDRHSQARLHGAQPTHRIMGYLFISSL